MTQSSDTANVAEVECPKEFHEALLNKLALLNPGESAKIAGPMPAPQLRALLHTVGFHRVHPWKPEDRQEGMTYFEAYKPRTELVPGVLALMSLPRYGLCSTFGCVTNALGPLKILLLQGGGVYWSESMTNLMEQALAKPNIRYILTIDYDTIFDSADVLHLLHLMEETPEAGAICATQMRRTKPTALISLKDGETHPPVELFEQELTEVRSAHFGLTVIRADALRKLSKPWFQAKPDTEGGWDYRKSYVAADVAFWVKFTETGLKLYQANYCAVGHTEEMIVWGSPRLTPVYQSMNEYHESGVPDEVLR